VEEVEMEDRKKPETLRLRSAVPGLTVNDLEQSIAWYRDVLGFMVKEEHRHEDKLLGASMQAGVVSFMLGQDDFAKGTDRVKGVGFRMYCETVQDIDELAAAIKARGGVLLAEPTDQPWGYRDFAVADPDGYEISIAKRLEEG
jgi:uncharacterized glyoxalase superfamily protein PhnB